MAEPILDPAYWRGRLEAAVAAGADYQSVFRCPPGRWAAVEARHREILAAAVGPDDSVLDCGCGYGRLLTLMPAAWHGYYHGLDLSPDMIEEARRRHPGRRFEVSDLGNLAGYAVVVPYSWAVLISVRPMVRRNLGDAAWNAMEGQVRRCARRLLYLEYDPDDPGSVE